MYFGLWVDLINRILSSPSCLGSALIINKSTQLTQQNNIPIINIATPNNAGISHNKYRQFNINNQGMILNNATNKVTSQLAGLINANSQLRGQAADLIINEVTSNQFSYLNGKLEVAGKKQRYLLLIRMGSLVMAVVLLIHTLLL